MKTAWNIPLSIALISLATFSATKAFALHGGKLGCAEKSGESACAEAFPYSVALEGPKGLCSATKVGPKQFLTARHCVGVIEAEAGTIKFPWRMVDGWWVHNRISPTNVRWDAFPGVGPGADLAVLTIDIDTPEVPSARVCLGSIEPGDEIVLTGWGNTTDLMGHDASPPDLHFGTARVSKIRNGYLVTAAEGQPPGVYEFPDAAPQVSSLHGDSGSGVFMRLSTGEKCLVAVEAAGSPQEQIRRYSYMDYQPILNDQGDRLALTWLREHVPSLQLALRSRNF